MLAIVEDISNSDPDTLDTIISKAELEARWARQRGENEVATFYEAFVHLLKQNRNTVNAKT